MLLSKNLSNKYSKLQSIFEEMDSVLIAYSGGVDSTFLLKVGTDTLGQKCVGVIGVAPSLASEEYDRAIRQAKQFKANLKTIHTHEMENPQYFNNDNDRCYFCKSELFFQLGKVSKELNIKYILEGSNADDVNDYRPGMKAASEQNIRSPLMEADLSKSEIRELSKYLGLNTWNQPSQPCLSSRIAYGIQIDADKLNKINAAERFIKSLGFKIVRVRHYNHYVSVEVGKDELDRLFSADIQDNIKNELQKIGFENIKFDPEGYESGKLNQLHKIS